MSGVVVLLLASLLIGQVGRGLVAAKAKAALIEAQAGYTEAQTKIDSTTAGESKQAIEGRLQGISRKCGLYFLLGRR